LGGSIRESFFPLTEEKGRLAARKEEPPSEKSMGRKKEEEAIELRINSKRGAKGRRIPGVFAVRKKRLSMHGISQEGGPENWATGAYVSPSLADRC